VIGWGMAEVSGRDLVRQSFRWVDGHADVWRLFSDAKVFATVIDGIVAPWRTAGITMIAGIESRGFLLGGASAIALRVGFVAIRKEGGLLPGMKHTVDTGIDYRGRRHRLRMQRTLRPTDRVLLVDDWVEKGSQASAARELVEASGATFAGLSVIVDQLDSAAKQMVAPVTALVTATELGPPLEPAGKV